MKNISKHFTLTFLFSLASFCLQFVAIIAAGTVVYIMVQIGILSEPEDSSQTFVVPLLFMIFISLIIGSVGSIFVSRISLKPIYQLIEKINRLAAGDFKARLQFKKPLLQKPAFHNLVESFNKMAEELEHTEMLRSDFINNFSHEFKTPIVSIAGFAKLLKKGNLTEEQKEECLGIIEEESLRLAAMATNVLNLTRVENQTILTEVAVFNLSEQLRSCILLLIDKWEKKNLDFKLDFKEYMISANEELLKQVWINLIDNAIKFSPKGGRVELHIQKNNDRIEVSILNSGEDISIEEQKKIFNKFYQADSSHSTEGNGIGLAIARRVTELHNGRITVQSRNCITVFTVELPVEQNPDNKII